jgi:3-hydroxybutyrate dehydrogenase
MLKGKAALVTGSTSGIGLAIAHALAREGANIMLNGFGDKAEIEKIRAGVEKDFGVKARYSPADMTKPGEIADMIRQNEPLQIRCDGCGKDYVVTTEELLTLSASAAGGGLFGGDGTRGMA